MDDAIKQKALDAVSKKHKLILDPNDPVFAVITIMETMMEETYKKTDAHAKIQLAFMQESNQKLYADAKQLAQTIIGAKVTEVVTNIDTLKKSAIQAIESAAHQNKIILEEKKQNQLQSNQTNLLIFGVGIASLLIGVTLGILYKG